MLTGGPGKGWGLKFSGRLKSSAISRVTDHLQRLFASRSPGERMQMACAMFTLAHATMRAGLTAQHAPASERELRVLELRRLYHDELELDRNALEDRIRDRHRG